jgi:hypothetical protein
MKTCGLHFLLLLSSPLIAQSPLGFVPVTPCRLVDTRLPDGPLGGPVIPAGQSRAFPLQGACGIPSNAAAYSLNVTAVPQESTLGFLTLFPDGQSLPLVSTLNSPDGRVRAVAALVRAGTAGSVRVYVANASHVILDVTGYFVPATGLQFRSINPCRVLSSYSLPAGGATTITIPSGCATAASNGQAFSINVTATPDGGPLGFLTVWPAGSPFPSVSTLNSPTGITVANAAIVAAGSGGQINIFVSNSATVTVDVNGYFAPAGPGGLWFYPLDPCRVHDTRDTGNPLLASLARNIPVSGYCSAPAAAAVYSLSATVVPSGYLGYLQMWRKDGPQPGTSILNAPDGAITSNAALVEAGGGGLVTAWASNQTHLILDINGYFQGDTAPQQQYQLITGVIPSGGGTIAPSCAAGCLYNSGQVVTVTATPGPGYSFAGFSGDLTGTANPQSLTMNGPKTVTATFTSISPLPPPPTRWNSVFYYPRRHEYHRMLFEWETVDGTITRYGRSYPGTGLLVKEVARRDLLMLAQNGINVVHLYLWDRSLLPQEAGRPIPGTSGSERAGFCDLPAHPQSDGSACDSSRQWAALQEFVGYAEDAGIYVVLHFASEKLKGSSPTPADYIAWTGKFMAHLAARRNVLAWGMGWEWPISDSNNMAWAEIYKGMDQNARAYSHTPGVTGLVGAYIQMFLSEQQFLINETEFKTLQRSHIQHRNQDAGPPAPTDSYKYDWAKTQANVELIRQSLAAVGHPRAYPDLYLFQAYAPNSRDLEAALLNLTSAAGIPASKIFIHEFATSSPMCDGPCPGQDPVKGNDVSSAGDDNVPALTPAGQATWLNNMLCAFHNAGVTKLNYFGMYDAYALWTDAQWGHTGDALAWFGYWGLAYQQETDGSKAAWTTLTNYYRNGAAALACGSRQVAATLRPENPTAYYITGQKIGVQWTAAETTQWEIAGVAATTPSYQCSYISVTDPLALTPITAFGHYHLDGSCASARLDPASSTGLRQYTFTARNSDGSSVTASTTVNVGDRPVVTGYQILPLNPPRVFIIVYGDGFNVEGGNTLQFVRDGHQDVWIYQGNTDDPARDWFDTSHGQINARIDGKLAPGQWTMYVRSNGVPTVGTAVTVP